MNIIVYTNWNYKCDVLWMSVNTISITIDKRVSCSLFVVSFFFCSTHSSCVYYNNNQAVAFVHIKFDSHLRCSAAKNVNEKQKCPRKTYNFAFDSSFEFISNCFCYLIIDRNLLTINICILCERLLFLFLGWNIFKVDCVGLLSKLK